MNEKRLHAERTVLIVEDEPAIAENIRYALETEGIGTRWCCTGKDACAFLADHTVDLVLLDVGLPDTNGFDLCRQIRAASSVPIIFLTARTNEIDRVVGLELGGDDYVVKPFSPRELSARVRAVLRRAGDPPRPAAGHSVFSVDRKRMVIAYRGRPLDLSRYEFRVLEVLIGRPGWVFSREKLMELAWEEPDASLERTIDTHIKTLRAKLRAVHPALDPIRTHRGLGYSLKESV